MVARPSTPAPTASGNWSTTSRSIAPTNVKQNAFWSAAHTSSESSSTTNSSVTTRGGCTSATAVALDSDGRPDRDEQEIEQWAREHDLPYFNEQVHFPD